MDDLVRLWIRLSFVHCLIHVAHPIGSFGCIVRVNCNSAAGFGLKLVFLNVYRLFQSVDEGL